MQLSKVLSNFSGVKNIQGILDGCVKTADASGMQ
jgi:hypothetical protein